MKKYLQRVLCGCGLVLLVIVITFALNTYKTSPDESSSTKLAYDYLLENSNLSSMQAIGILANIQQQSNFDSSVHSNTGFETVGLMCWCYQREVELSNYAKLTNRKSTDFYTQLDFILEEINPSSEYATYQLIDYNGYTVEDWINAKTPEESAKAFSNIYLRLNYQKNIELESLAQQINKEV